MVYVITLCLFSVIVIKYLIPVYKEWKFIWLMVLEAGNSKSTAPATAWNLVGPSFCIITGRRASNGETGKELQSLFLFL
jgi:hypothetical protein